MKRVLMVTAAWPPVARVGVRRPLRLARRLPKLGFQPTIMTPDPQSVFRRMPAMDHTLGVPDVPVLTVPAFFWSTRLSRLLAKLPSSLAYPASRLLEDVLYPDQYAEWTQAACRASDGLDGIDLVWVTGGPFGIFLAGAAMAQRMHVPLILDYRDPWTTANISRRTVFGPTVNRLHALEQRILSQAQGVAYVNQDMHDANLHKFERPQRAIWVTIPNGFAPEDMHHAQVHSFTRPTLIYAGACYASRSMLPMLEAIHEANERGLFCPDLHIYGELDPYALRYFTAHDFKGRVSLFGRIPSAELNGRLLGAHGLVLIIGEGHKTALSAKVFDYLQAQRPIFGVGPHDSAAAELVGRSNTGCWAQSREEILHNFALMAHGGFEYSPVVEHVKPYSADAMAQTTAELFQQVCALRE